MYFSGKDTFRKFEAEALFLVGSSVTLGFTLDRLQGRDLVKGFYNVFFVRPGDVMEVFFFKNGSSFIFEGLCLGLRGKSLQMPESSVILRSFINGVGVECVFSYFYNRLYSLRLKEYKNKTFSYSRSKFYFLRASLKRGFDSLKIR